MWSFWSFQHERWYAGPEKGLETPGKLKIFSDSSGGMQQSTPSSTQAKAIPFQIDFYVRQQGSFRHGIGLRLPSAASRHILCDD